LSELYFVYVYIVVIKVLCNLLGLQLCYSWQPGNPDSQWQCSPDPVQSKSSPMFISDLYHWSYSHSQGWRFNERRCTIL